LAPGRKQRLLYRILGEVEVAVASDQRPENLRCQPLQEILEGALVGI
jgi:hypothetical protein